MKKLMIAAAAAAIVGAAQAYIPSAPWDDCVKDADMCEPAVFKLTASGKLSMDMGSYKTVQSLKVKKGLLVAKLAQADDVCYPVTKAGYTAKVVPANVTESEGEIPVAATNVNNYHHHYVGHAATDYTVEKLAAKYDTLEAAQAGFLGKTMDAVIDAYDATGNLLKTTTVKDYYTIIGGPASLASVNQIVSSWTVQECEAGEGCKDCFDCADIYVNVTAGKRTYALKYQDMELLKWSIFGKKYADYAAVAGDNTTKYSYKLESEMALRCEDYSGAEIFDAVSLYMVGFGDATLKQYAANSGKGICRDGVCVPETSATFKFNGWFVGWYDTGVMPDEAIYTCDNCGAFLYGGTWTATYDAKLSEDFFGDASAESYIGRDLDDIIE